MGSTLPAKKAASVWLVMRVVWNAQALLLAYHVTLRMSSTMVAASIIVLKDGVRRAEHVRRAMRTGPVYHVVGQVLAQNANQATSCLKKAASILAPLDNT